MIRRINQTGRKSIRREDAQIFIRNGGDGVSSFDAKLDLSCYGLAPEGVVVIEAYRQTIWSRFEWGTVASLRPGGAATLAAFPEPNTVLFRVKVIAPGTRNGVLLAEVDRLRPKSLEEKEEKRIPLLSLKSEDLGEEIWRVNVDNEVARLLINSRCGDPLQVAQSAAFRALVYPAVVRGQLTSILIIEKHFDTEDLDDWRSAWLAFGQSLPGVFDAPGEGSSEQDRLEWIDSVVEVFCGQHDLLNGFVNSLTEAS